MLPGYLQLCSWISTLIHSGETWELVSWEHCFFLSTLLFSCSQHFHLCFGRQKMQLLVLEKQWNKSFFRIRTLGFDFVFIRRHASCRNSGWIFMQSSISILCTHWIHGPQRIDSADFSSSIILLGIPLLFLARPAPLNLWLVGFVVELTRSRYDHKFTIWVKCRDFIKRTKQFPWIKNWPLQASLTSATPRDSWRGWFVYWENYSS